MAFISRMTENAELLKSFENSIINIAVRGKKERIMYKNRSTLIMNENKSGNLCNMF